MIKMKVRNKAEFDMYKSEFNTLNNIESNFGVLEVKECTESIQGVNAKIKDIDCIVTKNGVIVDAGIQVDSPARAMRITTLSKFFVWKHDNTFELIKKIIIRDLVEAQVLLSGSYTDIADVEIASGVDVYKYFYTGATEQQSKQKDKIISPSKCEYAGSLICSPLRIRGYNPDILIKDKELTKKFGEVLTPPHIVSDMLDLVSKKSGMKTGMNTGTLPIRETFLEPSCGTGNFLVQILERKLRLCKTQEDMFYAVASIYGIDIQKDSVLESRLRMLEIVEEKLKVLKVVKNTEAFLKIIADILEKNIMGGDFINDKRGCMIGETFVKGTVRNASGLVEVDGIPHNRLIGYEWTWGNPIRSVVDFIVEK